MEFVTRLFSKPRGSFFLFGPRGTGKSTWLRRNIPEALSIDLLEPESYRTFLARPERLEQLVEGDPRVEIVVIDEVQKVPSLLDLVHRLIEANGHRRLQFVLTGSSARKLKRTGVDLLAGRLLLKTLHPFMAAELGEKFNLPRSLQLGMMPLVLGSADPEETLKSYISLYLREEVQMEGLVRNIGAFSRFLEALSFSHGSLLNTAQVARECQAGQKTVEGYLQVLEDLLLGFRLNVFTRRARRQLIAHPKFYYFDAGVFRTLRPKGPLDRPEEIGGACLEGLAAQHLRAWIAYGGGDCGMSFWRTRAGTEVDFVLYGKDCFAALEVKSAKTVYNRDVQPLVAFLEDYPGADACLLYMGKERIKINGVRCLPLEQFLRELIPGKPLPLG